MNFIDQFYLVLIYVGSELSKNANILMGAVLAMTISYLKTHKEKRKQNWSENLLCLSWLQYNQKITTNPDLIKNTTS